MAEAPSNSPDTEILIHISAPARAADDSRYRSMAAAYLQFKPLATRIDVHSTMDEHRMKEATSSLYGSSFSSIIDNMHSPRVPTIPEDEELRQQISLESQDSQSIIIQDSMPNNEHLNVQLSSPTRLLSYYLQQFSSSSDLGVSSSTGSNRAKEEEGDGSKQQNITTAPRQIDGSPMTEIEIPCSSTINILEVDDSWILAENSASRTQVAHSDEIIRDSTIIISETSFRLSLEAQEGTVDPGSLESKHPPIINSTQKPTLSQEENNDRPYVPYNTVCYTIDFLPSHGYTCDSLEVNAPDTLQISDAYIDPEGFLTPRLRKLAQDLNFAKRFRVETQTRELRPTERGYWLLDSTAWDPQLKRDVWAFLANYIGIGVAGWGVRCTRDYSFCSMRLYCWGYIAPHCYFLLYLATKRAVLFTGAKWVDGAGEVIITMKVRNEP
ncbi:hypothetical protein MGN70_007682 [Eutypa lata]|nr:hypothetical protein MGN70_007682 [Eutypa lata]